MRRLVMYQVVVCLLLLAKEFGTIEMGYEWSEGYAINDRGNSTV
jgi:hypothetical protein